MDYYSLSRNTSTCRSTHKQEKSLTTARRKTRFQAKKVEDVVHKLREETLELESILYTSLNEIQRLRSIVNQQQKQLVLQINQTTTPSVAPKVTIKAETDQDDEEKSCQSVDTFKCEKCESVFKRKYSLKVHLQYHCSKSVVKFVKDKKCPICKKEYTHNGLRSHLLGMGNALSNGRTPRGCHGKSTAKKHFALLSEIAKIKK